MKFIWYAINITFVVLGTIYMFPSTIAAHRRHNDLTGVMIFNLATGWTIIGWFVVLVWALYGKKGS